MKKLSLKILAAAIAFCMTFSPFAIFADETDAAVSRADATQLLYEAAGKPEVSGKLPFSDVDEAHKDACLWAAENGYIEGVGDGLYDSEALVTRQEFAVILHRAAGRIPAAPQSIGAYHDAEKAALWAQDALLWSIQSGVMNGRSESELAPEGTIVESEALAMIKRAEELPKASDILSDLNVLAASPRPIGSEGEKAAAEYLKERFLKMGYKTELLEYTDEDGKKGFNVIAKKAAETAENADILVLSAHHDGSENSYGANENASGVAALLYAAEALKDIPSDTELRFISFTGDKSGKSGARTYTSSLTDEEKERIIGDIQFDMLGGIGSDKTILYTTDGEANWISNLLKEINPSFDLKAETNSDHAIMQLAGIPSVLVMQNNRGYFYLSMGDMVSHLNLYKIADAAEDVISAVKGIMSEDTPSYKETAKKESAGYTYRQTKENIIRFGEDKNVTEGYIGISGTLAKSYENSGEGWKDSFECYLYPMRWFDGEEPMNTYYIYRNGFFETIEIRPEETGYTKDEVRTLIENMYGEPSSETEESVSWEDMMYGKYIELSEDEDGAKVLISEYSLGMANILSSYPVVGGEAEIEDKNDALAWKILCSVLPKETRQKITEFNLFTDGSSNVLAFTAAEEKDGKADNSHFSISVDYYDVFDENGNYRDQSKLVYTIIHEYGHVLLEDETQIDLNAGKDIHDTKGFIEGSFRKAFYDKFWKDIDGSGAGDYYENPTNYVREYSSNYFHEDIADTFSTFVLADMPEGDTLAEEKIRFFYSDEDMMAVRSAIRLNLGLDWPEYSE